MKTLKKVVLTVVAMILAAVALVAILCIVAPKEAKPAEWKEYTVVDGDIMWYVVKAECFQGDEDIRNAHDIQSVIRRIEEANEGLNANKLIPGTTIMIPVYDK